jgi:Na+(H+)/acetate symporter ActP
LSDRFIAIHPNGGFPFSVVVVFGVGTVVVVVVVVGLLFEAFWMKVASWVLLIAQSFLSILSFLLHWGERCPFLPQQ